VEERPRALGIIMIRIYGRFGCQYTKKLRNYLHDNDIQYQYYQLNEDFTREEFYELYPDHKTFPLVQVNDYYIGGCDDYIKHHKTWENDE
jgi:glutaredoxin